MPRLAQPISRVAWVRTEDAAGSLDAIKEIRLHDPVARRNVKSRLARLSIAHLLASVKGR
jgi:hypothetical protein